MDSRTAELVEGTMAEAFRESSVLMVAHRLSMVMHNCKKVIVMGKGQVQEVGHPR